MRPSNRIPLVRTALIIYSAHGLKRMRSARDPIQPPWTPGLVIRDRAALRAPLLEARDRSSANRCRERSRPLPARRLRIRSPSSEYPHSSDQTLQRRVDIKEERLDAVTVLMAEVPQPIVNGIRWRGFKRKSGESFSCRF